MKLHYFNKGVKRNNWVLTIPWFTARKFSWGHYSLFHHFSSKIIHFLKNIPPFLIGLNPPTYSSKPAEVYQIWKMRAIYHRHDGILPQWKNTQSQPWFQFINAWDSANICAQANHTLFVRPLIRKGKHKGGFAVSST